MTTLSPLTARRITITPGSRIMDVSLTPSSNGGFDESGIWKRAGEAGAEGGGGGGLDEVSIRRRDKAALIAYIASLEAQIYDLQHNMGLLIMERKESASKYEEATSSGEKAEVKLLREKAALSSVLAEARKREENLKKALGVEKECVANLEKALHELRAECAEVKVTADSKMVEARRMFEDAQQKYAEAEVKLRTAESLQEDARRSERAAGRKLLEVEAREDDVRRKMSSFKSDADAKEKELILERQSLVERQRGLSESQNRLLDSQALLNQREADILSKQQALKRLERELEDKMENIAAETRALTEQKSDLELNALSLLEREKVVVEKEVLLSKKEKELLVAQEALASKEHQEIQNILAEQEMALKCKRDEFEAELLQKQKVVEDDMEKKRRAWELRELDLKQREDLILEKEQELEVQSRVITDKGKDLAEKVNNVQERECHLNKLESEIELTESLLQKEREEINKAKIDLESSLISMETEKKQISEEKMRLELMKSETSELLLLETKLKEEIDMIRAQKQQLDVEAEKLMVEKSKFETEWEIIDVKREELRREEERISEEKGVISKFLKDGRDSLNMEKEALREQYKQDLESLNHDREAFMSECQRERSDWFSKFQKERADFLLEIECRKREMEAFDDKLREDIESRLKEKERKFEEEKRIDLQHIASLKEDLMKEQEQAAIALKKLETEKLEIKLDREQRDKAWAELQSLIEELQMQRLKLKEQREMLHADREEIHYQIAELKDLEDVRVDSGMPKTCVESTPQVFIRVLESEQTHKLQLHSTEDTQNLEGDSPPSSSVSWLRKCASLIFKHPSEDFKHMESSLDSANEVEKLESVEKDTSRIDEIIRTQQEMPIVAPSIGNDSQPGKTGSEEPKVIREVPSIHEEASPLFVGKNAHESCVPSITTPRSRKRRIGILSALGSDDELQNDEMSSKKRRQEDQDGHNARLVCDPPTKSKQPSDEFQHAVNSSSQNEKSKEEIVKSLEVERHSKITLDLVDIGISHAQVRRSQIEQSVQIENESYTCTIMERTVVQEEDILNDEESNKPNEALYQEQALSELLEDEDHPEAKIDKTDAVKQKRKQRSKPKKKV